MTTNCKGMHPGLVLLDSRMGLKSKAWNVCYTLLQILRVCIPEIDHDLALRYPKGETYHELGQLLRATDIADVRPLRSCINQLMPPSEQFRDRRQEDPSEFLERLLDCLEMEAEDADCEVEEEDVHPKPWYIPGLIIESIRVQTAPYYQCVRLASLLMTMIFKYRPPTIVYVYTSLVKSNRIYSPW